MKGDDLLAARFAGTRLRMELDQVPLWRGDHVPVRQVVEDFASYLYLPRLQDPDVLLQAVAGGVGLLTWADDSFGYADRFDEQAGRYVGLRGGQAMPLTDVDAAEVIVNADVARRQLDAERAPAVPPRPDAGDEPTVTPPGPEPEPPQPDPRPTRFHGSVSLDVTRTGRDAGRIADEVITHLAGLVGANVKVTLEIEADIPAGAPDHVVRTVTENSRTLKFSSHGFERE